MPQAPAARLFSQISFPPPLLLLIAELLQAYSARDSVLPFRDAFRSAAERTPIYSLCHDTLERTDAGMRDVRLRRANRRSPVPHRARGLDHQPPTGGDRDAASASSFLP